MDAQLELICSEEIKEAFVRVIIKTVEGIPVTMITNEESFSIKKDANGVLKFNVDISKLVPGRYALSFVIYEVSEYGYDRYLDGLKNVFYFEITNDNKFNNNMVWKPKYWGYYYGENLLINSDFS